MKCPAVYLVGEGAHAEILSGRVLRAPTAPGRRQQGHHAAPNARRSVITSKSVSKDGGRGSYRGLVKVHDGAHGSKVSVKCDALILDDKSRSDTYPTMEVDENRVSIEHEATVSKVGEEQVFYLQSRGLTEQEATLLIVNGFIEPFTKELPMEYAVELNRPSSSRWKSSARGSPWAKSLSPACCSASSTRSPRRSRVARAARRDVGAWGEPPPRPRGAPLALHRPGELLPDPRAAAPVEVLGDLPDDFHDGIFRTRPPTRLQGWRSAPLDDRPMLASRGLSSRSAMPRGRTRIVRPALLPGRDCDGRREVRPLSAAPSPAARCPRPGGLELEFPVRRAAPRRATATRSLVVIGAHAKATSSST
jgi:hypothetical protein